MPNDQNKERKQTYRIVEAPSSRKLEEILNKSEFMMYEVEEFKVVTPHKADSPYRYVALLKHKLSD